MFSGDCHGPNGSCGGCQPWNRGIDGSLCRFPPSEAGESSRSGHEREKSRLILEREPRVGDSVVESSDGSRRSLEPSFTAPLWKSEIVLWKPGILSDGKTVA